MLISYRLNQKHQYYVQGDWHMLEGHNSELLFVGNSRTYKHVDPIFLDSALHTTSEVIAQDGQTIDFIWVKFREYTKVNSAPKEIYVQTDHFTLFLHDKLYGIQNISPYFFMKRIDLSDLSTKGGYHSYYTYLPMMAMKFEYIRKMILDDTLKNYSFKKNRGAELVDQEWSGDWQNTPEVTFDPEHPCLRFIDSFFNYCKTNNVKLNFIFPPMSAPSLKNIKASDRIEQVIAKKSVKYGYPAHYRNYTDTTLYNDSTLFYNHMHMNRRGVKVFMHQLLSDPEIFTSFRQLTDITGSNTQ
ncbi:hypothetical protein KC960_05585 [Candidatus Saccharibacteria bacterium]|nr:hypothetical protein [Candidatus Saccharibacteria bacterium]